MSKDANIDELTDRLGKTVERIEALQQKKPLGTRLLQHLSKQGNFVVNAALAGCVFFVAVGRLHQKNEYQNERDQWEEQKRKLQQENFRLKQDQQSMEVQLRQLKHSLHSELDGAGWRLAPVAKRLREVLGPEDQLPEAQNEALVQEQTVGGQRPGGRVTLFRPT